MPADEFKELTTAEDTITLPINGKKYVINAVDADMGLFLTELSTVVTAADSGSDPSQEQLDAMKALAQKLDLNSEQGMQRLLGPAYEQMKDDGVPFVKLQRVVQTIVTWTVVDKKTAVMVWNGMPPKARQPQDRRAGKASASTTKKQASTSRTKKQGPGRPGPSS